MIRPHCRSSMPRTTARVQKYAPSRLTSSTSRQRAVSINMMCASRVIAGVVDQHVDGPELLFRLGEERLHRALVRDVALRRPGPRPVGPRPALPPPPRRRPAIGRRSPPPRRAPPAARRSPADAARAAGDDSHAAVQLKVIEGHAASSGGSGRTANPESIRELPVQGRVETGVSREKAEGRRENSALRGVIATRARR